MALSNFSGAQGEANAGYQNYQPLQSTNAAPMFNGYQAQNAQAANVNALGGQQYANAQSGLASQLQAQAQGVGGPNMAQQQLQQGEQANLAGALAAAASQRGNQNPGASARQIGENQAAINAGATGQAGQLAAQQQLGAQQALAGANQQGFGMAAQQAGFNQQAGLANQAAQNNAGQFNAQSQQALAALQNQQNQYQNTLGANIQQQQNQAGLGFVMQNNAAANSQQTNALNPSSYLSAAGGVTSAALAPGAADGTGGPIQTPITATVGENGPEIAKLAPGSEVIPLDRPNTGAGIKPIDDVQALLQHPAFRAALKAEVGDQIMSHRIAALEAAVAGKKGGEK